MLPINVDYNKEVIFIIQEWNVQNKKINKAYNAQLQFFCNVLPFCKENKILVREYMDHNLL